MKNQDNLFEEGDPFNDPQWKAAKTTTQAADFVGCPMTWLEQVLPHLQGASQLAVALLLYRRWILGGIRRTFEFPNAGLNRLGIARQVKYRALAKLEGAGLITIERTHGQAARVTRRWK